MFTVKDLQVYKDSLKEKNSIRAGAAAEKTTAPVKTTTPSVTRPAKQHLQPQPLKLHAVPDEPSKERKPLAVVHKPANTTSPKPPADPVSKSKVSIAKTPAPSKTTHIAEGHQAPAKTAAPSKAAHITEGHQAPIKTPEYRSDFLKTPLKTTPSPKVPHHVKPDATTRKLKESPSPNGLHQKTSPKSSPSLCSECTRAASEGAVCFIGNDGRVSACTTRSAVRLCKNLNCAANNPDYVAAMASAPKKYLVSKRHILKAQYRLKSKSARPKSPQAEVVDASTGDGLERPSNDALSPNCTGYKVSGDCDSLSDEGQLSPINGSSPVPSDDVLSPNCTGYKISGDCDSPSDEKLSPIHDSSPVPGDGLAAPLNDSGGHSLVDLSRNQLDGREDGIEESHDCLDAPSRDAIVLRQAEFSFHEPEAEVESPKFVLAESFTKPIEADGEVNDDASSGKGVDEEDRTNSPFFQAPDVEGEESIKEDADIISQHHVDDQINIQPQADPLQAQADGSDGELSHDQTGSEEACDELRNDDHDDDDNDQSGKNMLDIGNDGDLSPLNDMHKDVIEDDYDDDIDNDHDEEGVNYSTSSAEENTQDESSKGIDGTLANGDSEGQDGSSGGSSTKPGNKQRRRRIVGVVEEPNPETVILRKQQTQEKKQVEEWMANYAIEGAVHKLAPTGETKVKVLVEAFETIICHTDLEAIDHNASQDGHT